jgi:tryptophan synthase alpha chain
MTSIISRRFEEARSRGRCGYVPYVTGGFPDPDACLEVMAVFDQCGADVIEVGLPFSDPLADGPVIQATSHLALEAGATPRGVLESIGRAAPTLSAPVVVMTYYNPILQMGLEAFAKMAGDNGVAGVIVPDLPPEEAGQWLEVARKHRLDTIFMCSPGTPDQRLARIGSVCRGFLYYVSMDGVTGSDLSLDRSRLAAIDRVRRTASLPVAVGFGVAGADQARRLAAVADGVVVGSALMKPLLNGEPLAEGLRRVRDLSQGIQRGLIK